MNVVESSRRVTSIPFAQFRVLRAASTLAWRESIRTGDRTIHRSSRWPHSRCMPRGGSLEFWDCTPYAPDAFIDGAKPFWLASLTGARRCQVAGSAFASALRRTAADALSEPRGVSDAVVHTALFPR